MSIKNSLKNIYENENVSAKQLSEVFSGMLSGKLSAVQISAVLMALKCRGESAEMIKGAASSLLKAAIPFEVASDLNVVDCCGTGGDGKGLLNISTTVSFVAAACGLKVVKHGNRAVSSNSGSADVLEHLGIAPMDNVDILKQQLTGIGLTFLFAPYFHPALKQVMPVRKELATRTLFNVLGPIINPARPRIQLMGVYDKTLCRPVAETLKYLGCEHALVVHGSGLDEIAIHDVTYFSEIKSGEIHDGVFTLESMGVKYFPLTELQGRDPAFNAEQITLLLKGQGSAAFEEAVAVNCGALLYCAGKVSTISEGVQRAKKAIHDNSALEILQSMQHTKQES